TDKLKNHKKAVKNEQARTREPEEYKAEARKAKPQSKSAKRSTSIRKGQISHIISHLSSHSRGDTSSMEEAQEYVGICTKSLSKEAQVSLKRIATLAIRVRSLSDPTAKNQDSMID
ncbi:hypothetical protein Tco_1374723, partial [Tanacetum coccineum]